MKKILVWKRVFIVASIFSITVLQALTVTKTYSGPTVEIDGVGDYGTQLPSLSFTVSDFYAGATITKVTASIDWTKTDGTCASPAGGAPYHGETSFRLDGPSGNEILAVSDTWSGQTVIGDVTTLFDQLAASIPSGTPVGGTFRPNGGDLNVYNGINPIGSWNLSAGDDAGQDPLCVHAYSISITVLDPDQDTDGDSVFDYIDVDDDNDGVLDTVEDTPIVFNATGSSSTGNTRDRINAEGPIETEGSSANNGNSAELRNSGDTLTLDLGVTLPAGTVITLSMARDSGNTANSITISGGGSSLTLTNGDWSSSDILKYFDFTLASPADSLLFTLNSNRDIWVDGLQVIYGDPNYFDIDQDGLNNSLDLDSDNDGIPDNVEAQITDPYIAPNGDAGPGNNGLDSAYTGGLTPIHTDSDGIPDYFDSDSDDDNITDCEEGIKNTVASKACPVVLGGTDTNGLVEWAETGGTDQGYTEVNGIVSDPLLDLQDILDASDSEVDYRQFNTCGPSTLALTAWQWKIISFGCDTDTNSIDTLLGNSLGVYGTNWVMHEQIAYTGSNSTDMTLMNDTDTVQPGKGYWIISDQDVDMTVDLSAPSIVKTPVVLKTDFAGVAGTAFDEVMQYTLPNSQTDRKTKVMLGNPFHKKFQLSDMYYNHNGATYYPMGDTANIGDYVEFTVYAHDSADTSSANDQYRAITPDTPGFTDPVGPMIGFFLLMKVDANAQSNSVVFPLEK